VNLIHSQTYNLKSTIDNFSFSDLDIMAGNQTEMINEKHHELYIPPSDEIHVET